MKNIFAFSPSDNGEFTIKAPKKVKASKYDKTKNISDSLSQNLEIIKELMHFPTCSDLKLRFFDTTVNGKKINILVTFYDGLIDSNILDNFIIKQFMKEKNSDKNLHDIILRFDTCRMPSV